MKATDQINFKSTNKEIRDLAPGVTWQIQAQPGTKIYITPMQFSQEECEHKYWERGRCEDCGYSPYDGEED